VTLTFTLTSKVVCKLHVTWATFVLIVGFLELFFFESRTGMGQTDRQTGRIVLS